MKRTELENTVEKMAKTMTTEQIVSHIKNSKAEIWSQRQHYPNGVYVYDNSPTGGVMIGKRN